MGTESVVVVDGMWCACAFLLWFGSAHAGGLPKQENEDCPDGYYTGEYPNQCLSCSEICYLNMDYYTALNCKYICPVVYKELMNQEAKQMLTTSAPASSQNPQSNLQTTHSNVHYAVIITIAILIAFCLTFIAILAVNIHRSRSRSKINSRRSMPRSCWSRERNSANQSDSEESIPIPVENTENHGNGHIHGPVPVIVPSGRAYTENNVQYPMSDLETVV